jgi:hypothetical protein
MAANVMYTGDPQAGQKARVFTQCVASPATFTCARDGKVR